MNAKKEDPFPWMRPSIRLSPLSSYDGRRRKDKRLTYKRGSQEICISQLPPVNESYIFIRSTISAAFALPATPPKPVSRRLTSILSPTSFMASIT